MDLIQHLTNRITALPAGESITISVQELLISRADFQSIATYLRKESQHGFFSILSSGQQLSWFDRTSLTIHKH